MDFTPGGLLTNEVMRDKFFKRIPLPFQGQIKSEFEQRIKEIKKERSKIKYQDTVKAMRDSFYSYADSMIKLVNEYKPLTKKLAFNEDEIQKKSWLLSNDLFSIQSEFKTHFMIDESASDAQESGALMAMVQVYRRFERLTYWGLTEDYKRDYFYKDFEPENLLTIKPLDMDKYFSDREYQSEILSTILKALEPDWWFRRYKKAFARMAEEFAIAAGLVNKQSRYCTDFSLYRVKGQDYKNQLFLEGIEIEREDGFRVSLGEVIKHSLSNPFNRHAQLMARIAGLEKLGKHENLNASFYTITAPSRFHKNSPKYDGSTPNQAREYLQKNWAAVRARLKDAGLYHFGIRVAEAHKDGCPHWHIMLWVKPSEQNAIDTIFKKQILKDSQDELTFKNNVFHGGFVLYQPKKMDRVKGVVFRTARLEIKRMLPHLGHPTGYIIKYISKNIKSHNESKAPDEVLTYADRVNAWARTHRIRQFQFIGDATVSQWNEARRVSPEIIKQKSLTLTDTEQRFIDVCRSNDWFQYVLFMRRFNITVKKKTERDIESQFFTNKTEILGVEVQEKNVMRRLHKQNLKRYTLGIKTVDKASYEFSKMMVNFYDKNSALFQTRFYTWTKSHKPPDRAKKRSPEGVS